MQAGDILRVLPGETVPVDGVILPGQTSINQAVMTGESLPVDKDVGDMVSSGTVNQFGSFDMKATRVGEDSSIQRMICSGQRTPARPNVGIATRPPGLSSSPDRRLTSVVITRAGQYSGVATPCALVLATGLSATRPNTAFWCGRVTRWNVWPGSSASALTKPEP